MHSGPSAVSSYYYIRPILTLAVVPYLLRQGRSWRRRRFLRPWYNFCAIHQTLTTWKFALYKISLNIQTGLTWWVPWILGHHWSRRWSGFILNMSPYLYGEWMGKSQLSLEAQHSGLESLLLLLALLLLLLLQQLLMFPQSISRSVAAVGTNMVLGHSFGLIQNSVSDSCSCVKWFCIMYAVLV